MENYKKLYQHIINCVCSATTSRIELEDIKDTYNVSLSDKIVATIDKSIRHLGWSASYDFWDDKVVLTQTDIESMPRPRYDLFRNPGVFLGSEVSLVLLVLALFNKVPFWIILLPALVPIISLIFLWITWEFLNKKHNTRMEQKYNDRKE